VRAVRTCDARRRRVVHAYSCAITRAVRTRCRALIAHAARVVARQLHMVTRGRECCLCAPSHVTRSLFPRVALIFVVSHVIVEWLIIGLSED
jgi:hypothetical protein